MQVNIPSDVNRIVPKMSRLYIWQSTVWRDQRRNISKFVAVKLMTEEPKSAAAISLSAVVVFRFCFISFSHYHFLAELRSKPIAGWISKLI